MTTQRHSQIIAPRKQIAIHPKRDAPFLDLTALDDAAVTRVMARPDPARAIALAAHLSRQATRNENQGNLL